MTVTVLVWAYLGGIAGALLMDVTEAHAARFGISSGVNLDLLGRWVLGLPRGQIRHTNILTAWPGRGEARAGQAFHFLIGGGGVALLYPAFCQLLGLPLIGHFWMAGLLFGLATSLLPWLILLPCFGWGLFGFKGPRGSNAWLASPLSHIPYGLGVGCTTALGLYVGW